MIKKHYKLTKATVKCKPKNIRVFFEKMCGLDFGNFNLNLNSNFNKKISKDKY